MSGSDVFFEILKSIPRFWDFIVRNRDFLAGRFGGDTPEWLMFFAISERHGSTGMIIRAVIYFLLYIVLCVWLSKLAKIPLRLADQHMKAHNCGLNFNGVLYLIAAAIFLIDLFFVRVVEIGFDSLFSPVAYIVLLFAAIRMLIRVKWRAVYFLPLQCLILAYLYFVTLIVFPVVIILLIGAAMGNATQGWGRKYVYKCQRCGRTLSAGESCMCQS